MATFKREIKKLPSEQNLRLLSSLVISLANKTSSVEDKCIAPWKAEETYQKDVSLVIYNGYIYFCTVTNKDAVFTESHWMKLADNFDELSVEDVKAMLNLSSEELANLQSLIDDTTITTTKTNSSSKIYMDIQAAIAECKDDTLKQIAKKVSGSYKIAASTSEVTSADFIYLINNGANYDLYVLVDSVPTKIGDSSIDLDDFYTKTEVDNDFLKKTDATSTYATITTVDGKVDKTNIVDNLTSTDTDKPLSANQGKVLKDEVDLKANDSDVVKKTDINTTIDSTSTDDTVPTNKAVYSALSSNLKDAKIMFFDFGGEFNNTTLGVNSTNTITEIVRAFGNYIINTYGKEQYAILEFATNNNNSAFNQSLPNNKQSCIGTVKYMPWQHTNRVQVILTDLINGNSYIGTLNNSTTDDIVWKRLCTTSVADVPMKFIAAVDDTANYTNHSTNGTKYYVKDGVCEVSLYIDCTTPSDKVVNVLSGLPKAYTYSYFVIHAWNAGFSDYVMAEITPTGALNLKKGTAGGSYLGTFSYMVKE